MKANIFIAHESPFDSIGHKAGGAAVVALKQTRALQTIDPNNQYRIVFPANGFKETEDPNLVCFDKPALIGPELVKRLIQPRSLEKFREIFKDAKFNYAHYFVAGKVLIDLKKQIDSPVVFMAHTWDKITSQFDPTRVLLRQRVEIEQEIVEKADLIVIATNAEREIFSQVYASTKISTEEILNKTVVVTLGVDHKLFNAEKIEKIRESARKKFLPEKFQQSKSFYMLGRIVPEKRQLEATEAFAKLYSNNSNLDITLSIFGGALNKNYFNKIENLISTFPEETKERIFFHGPQLPNEAIASGDIFIGPSTWESWYMALTEAMTCGKPSIVSDTPVLREVAQNSALFLDPQVPIVQSLSTAMEKLVLDADLRHQLQKMGKNNSKKYNWLDSARAILSAVNKYV